MKIISGIANYFRNRNKSWNTVTEETTYPQNSVLVSGKRVVEREVLKPGSLRPGEQEKIFNPAERELREKVLFRNGLVITGDARKEEVTIQPPNANPIIVSGATLTVNPNGFTIATKKLKQVVSTNGSFALTDLANCYKRFSSHYYNTYNVSAQGGVSGQAYSKKYGGAYNISGDETQEGYVRANGALIAPFVQRQYLVAPPAEQPTN